MDGALVVDIGCGDVVSFQRILWMGKASLSEIDPLAYFFKRHNRKYKRTSRSRLGIIDYSHPSGRGRRVAYYRAELSGPLLLPG